MGSAANTVYVATTGNDAVSCSQAQNAATPKRTLQEAVGCLDAGDTLYIRAGTYTEGVYVAKLFGTASQPITIAGYPSDARPVLRPPSSWNSSVMTFDAGGSETDSYVTLKDLDMDGSDLVFTNASLPCLTVALNRMTLENLRCVNAPGNGFTIASRRNTIRNNTITGCGRIQSPSICSDTKGVGMYVTSEDHLIEHNVIDGCRAAGMVLQFSAPTNITVRNNVFKHFGTSSPWPALACTASIYTGVGINIGPEARNNFIYNNIFAHITGVNGDATCINIYDNADATHVYNNTCYDADSGIWYGLGAPGPAYNADVRNNLFSNVKYLVGGQQSATIFVNNLVNPSVTATFVNAVADDFRLKSGSPANKAGATISMVTDDFKGTPRPQGGAYAIGAYECSEQPSRQLSPPTNLSITGN